MEQDELSFFAGGNANWYSFWKTVLQLLRKLNIILSYSPAIVFLPKGVENLHPYKNLHTNAYSSITDNCQDFKAAKISFSRWIDKLWSTYAMEYYSVLKRNELLSHEKTGRILKIFCLIIMHIIKQKKPIWKFYIL